MGRGAQERELERVAAEQQAGARGGQARGVVEERVGSEEGEEHGGGGCVSSLVAAARGGVGGAVGWGERGEGNGDSGVAGEVGEEVRSAAQHVPPPDWWTGGLWGTVGGKIS